MIRLDHLPRKNSEDAATETDESECSNARILAGNLALDANDRAEAGSDEELRVEAGEEKRREVP
jgi:hypothetical protein